MPVNQEYEVKLDVFEGPLDLLLYLVNRSEVDITEISVSQIAEQYLQYLDLMRDLNIDIAAEYLHMAATLVRLKARELLPAGDAEALPEEEGIYNREQLIAQLIEYKKFKEAAQSFKQLEAHQSGSFPRGRMEALEASGEAAGAIMPGTLTMYDLLAAFQNVLKRATDEYRHTVKLENIKIDDRIDHVLGILSDNAEVPFEELFSDDTRKIVLIVTFMAILELIKMQLVAFRQEDVFGPIFVSGRKPDPSLASAAQEEIKPENNATDNAPGVQDTSSKLNQALPQ
ncbi:MAG: segregation/condensation protein A [Chitinivibrionales bacterium]|nr:segregation/condensation protein A [Chitinivibrionales bacterium]